MNTDAEIIHLYPTQQLVAKIKKTLRGKLFS